MTDVNLHYVYRGYNSNNELLYIGCTANLKERLSAHKRGPFGSEIGFFKSEVFGCFEAAHKAEKEAIFEEQPIHNFQHKGFTPPPEKPLEIDDE
jgi:predicted GIY-YIG superfamily endonuclease